MRLDEDTLHELLSTDDNANESDRAAFKRITTQGSEKIVDSQEITHLLTALIKCCNHPYILTPELTNECIENDDFVNSSSKLLALDKLLPYLKSKKSRPLIFSKSTNVLDLLEKYCKWRGYNYCRLDGGTPQILREFEMARCKSFFLIFLIYSQP
jgi:SNF2 family DNA or RNA helicase